MSLSNKLAKLKIKDSNLTYGICRLFFVKAAEEQGKEKLVQKNTKQNTTVGYLDNLQIL